MENFLRLKYIEGSKIFSEVYNITGINRVDAFLEDQNKNRISGTDIVSMISRNVKIIPKVGDPIIGLFVGEKRLREYSKGTIFVIELSPGIRAFISRDEISYIILSETGYINVALDETKITNLFE